MITEIVENENLKELFFEDEALLKSCFIELLTFCNARCSHCYLPCNENYMMDFQTFKKLIDDLKEVGCNNVVLTGGEVFIHPDFIKMYEYAYDNLTFVSINSNLTMLSDEILELFKEKRPFAIEASIYGYDEESYFNFTNVSGLFEKFDWAVSKCMEFNLPLTLKTPITTLSVKYFDKVREYAKSKNIYFRYDYLIFPQLDHSMERCNNNRLSPKEVLNFIVSNEETYNYFKNKVKESPKNLNGKVFACIAGKDAIYICADGNIKMCMAMSRSDFNIKEKSISETLKAFEVIRETTLVTNDNKCNNCNYSNVCKYCPARFKLETGELQKCPDWYCELAKLINEYNW